MKKKAVIAENDKFKSCTSEDYNYFFKKDDGMFYRWGKTRDDDPVMAPAPEIMDIEIATVCDGVGAPCKFCYKSNSRNGKQMSFESFKKLFDKLPRSITQVAFGIGNLYDYQDMWKIFQYTRDNGVIPNVTTNGHRLTDEVADKLAELMGAVAVSRYNPKDTCYDAVKKLTDRGMAQVNIHMLVSKETYEDCLELIEDVKKDPRLEKLNAVVFLMLKPKGRGEKLNHIGDSMRYKSIISKAFDAGINIGFDSCGAPSFLKAVEDNDNIEMFKTLSDPCESGLFSLYASVDGEVFPCSFVEGTPGWETGISIIDSEDFIEDVWNSDRMKEWRGALLKSSTEGECDTCSLNSGCRSCPVYNINLCGGGKPKNEFNKA
jgi:MoaA/NifB/PqqE/SkfB family radical SAM enzyme